jgi:rod shape-determining protein MreC
MSRIIKRNNNFIFIFLVAVGLLIFLHSTKIISPLENFIVSIFKPLQTISYNSASKISVFFSRFGNINTLIDDNRKLKDEVEKLLVENIKLKIVIEENKIISEEVEFLKEKKYESVAARVIGVSPDPTIHSLIINKGKNNSIKEGLPVIVGPGILVGRVVEVDDDITKILLITDSQSKTSGIVQNSKGSQGIISGEYGIYFKMELIPYDDLIEPGQYVITSGLETNIPKGLIIGQIDKVSKSPGELFQSATIRPLRSLDNLVILSVIL